MSRYAKQNRKNLPSGGSIYSPAPATARRYGVTPMTIYRWERDPEMGFPQPVYFGRFKYHLIEELVAWERAQPRGPRTADEIEGAAA